MLHEKGLENDTKEIKAIIQKKKKKKKETKKANGRPGGASL
jgi:hypothetical protein